MVNKMASGFDFVISSGSDALLSSSPATIFFAILVGTYVGALQSLMLDLIWPDDEMIKTLPTRHGCFFFLLLLLGILIGVDSVTTFYGDPFLSSLTLTYSVITSMHGFKKIILYLRQNSKGERVSLSLSVP